MICGITLAICFLHWPQWGGMFCGPKVRKDATHGGVLQPSVCPGVCPVNTLAAASLTAGWHVLRAAVMSIALEGVSTAAWARRLHHAPWGGTARTALLKGV